MDPRELIQLSKFLSLVLRHQPQRLGLVLDGGGWVDVDALIAACRAHGKPLTRELLETLVVTSPKRRLALSADGRRVRASQGHTVDVELGYAPAPPPAVLFHGTIAASLLAIRSEGLKKMARHHVHLSPDEATARTVGMRRGTPVVLRIAAERMHADGHVFYVSANGVWLTEHVPPRYIDPGEA